MGGGGSADAPEIQTGAKAWEILIIWRSFRPLQTMAGFVEELNVGSFRLRSISLRGTEHS